MHVVPVRGCEPDIVWRISRVEHGEQLAVPGKITGGYDTVGAVVCAGVLQWRIVVTASPASALAETLPGQPCGCDPVEDACGSDTTLTDSIGNPVGASGCDLGIAGCGAAVA